MWLTPEHPDPKGSSLAILATALKHLIVGGRRWGVFWDFLSLHQFPEQGRRLPEEDKLFETAVKAMPMLFMHTHTTVLHQTRLPKDYPEEYGLATTANQAEYMRRGWVRATASIAHTLTRRRDCALTETMPTSSGARSALPRYAGRVPTRRRRPRR